MTNNKIWDWDDTENLKRPNSTLWEFSVTPFSKDEEAAKARVKEARDQMTIDKIGEKVRGWVGKINLDNLDWRIDRDFNEDIPWHWSSTEQLKKIFETCERWSKWELLVIIFVINNPKTTPEDLEYYFDNIQEWSEAEYWIAQALIAHSDLTQKLFDKNYGMAMQKWGKVFDLFEQADKERANRKILNWILIPQDSNSRDIEITLEDNTEIVELYVSEDHVPTIDDKWWVSRKSFSLTLSEWNWRKWVTVYLKDKAWNIIERDYIVLLKTDKTKEDKEKMENTMQGTVSKIDFERGTWEIHWDNGKDYLLHFSHIKGDNKAEIFNELTLGSEVKFKLVPYNWKQWLGLDPDFMAMDIVVKS